jgi:hypothetical protein
MSGFAIYVQEGFGVEGHAVYFTNEAPTYEAESMPVFARVADTTEKVQVGEREETFALFTPLNGPMRQRGKINRVPFQRLLAVVEQTDTNGGDDHV